MSGKFPEHIREQLPVGRQNEVDHAVRIAHSARRHASAFTGLVPSLVFTGEAGFSLVGDGDVGRRATQAGQVKGALSA